MTIRDDQIKSLANEKRMEILRLLNEPAEHFGHQQSADPVEFGVCINLIAEKIGLAQPTVSRHIDVLKRAGFLTIRRYQKWSYCSRDEVALNEYLNWLAEDLSIR
ncbi:MAG: transcriptional regulator [Ponticaulis sp.]|nr:transcriptional regulator [Ponticaulis sp.]